MCLHTMKMFDDFNQDDDDNDAFLYCPWPKVNQIYLPVLGEGNAACPFGFGTALDSAT